VIPYLPAFSVGPVNSFGVLVMVGVFAGSIAAYRHGERLGLDPRQVRRMALFCGVFGLMGAHLVDVLFYQPGWWEKDGAISTLLNPFAGISSYGGLIGGTLGFILFAHLSGIKKLRYADPAALGVLVLLVFGRAGCASVHDHIGVATDFALAVDFPPGNPSGVAGPHHDLGLYEFAYLLLLLGVAALLFRKPRRRGLLLGFLAVSYAVPRFFVEFLRREASDPRYLDLTPAQWSSIAAVAAGVAVLIWVHARKQAPPDPYAEPTPWRRYLSDPFRLRPTRAGV
jgi:phosphatidylglycerol:prolipoprotein diacylglycerol transferase